MLAGGVGHVVDEVLGGAQNQLLVSDIEVLWKDERLIGLVTLVTEEPILVRVPSFMCGTVLASAFVVWTSKASVFFFPLGVDTPSPN